MQLAEFGLIVSALQFCVALHAHAYMPRHDHIQNYVLSSDTYDTPEAVFTQSTKSLYFSEAGVDIQYPKVYTTITAARQNTQTPLGKQYRTSLQPTTIGPHYHLQAVPSQVWTGNKGDSSARRFGNNSSAVHYPTFHSTATPFINASLKPSISTGSAGGTPKYHSSFSSSGSHRGRRTSRFAVFLTILILTGAVLFIWS